MNWNSISEKTRQACEKENCWRTQKCHSSSYQQFPRIESHYCRATTSRQYWDPAL